MVIYNSPEEYKLNRTLYGYSVDNGGIYIEGIGTFFTYERTPEESIYSLEDFSVMSLLITYKDVI